MNIVGEKIVLRAIEPADNLMLLKLINDPETEAMLGGKSWPVSEYEQQKWFERAGTSKEIFRCIISEKVSKNAVGTLILSDIDYINGVAQIHIKMDKCIGRGKGYGSDAVNVAVKYAFNEMRLNCIYAEILECNDISVKLFEKCGFQKEGLLRARVYKSGKHLNVLSYSKVKE